MSKTKKVAEPIKEESKGPKPTGVLKLNLVVKQVGRNLNVVLGNEKFTRVGTSEELQVVKDLAKKYNEKPTKANLDALSKSLRPETTKKEVEETKLKAEIKATKKKVEEEVEQVKKKKTDIKAVVAEIDDKLMSTQELDEMEAAIKRQREKIAPVARVNPVPRSGESYRR